MKKNAAARAIAILTLLGQGACDPGMVGGEEDDDFGEEVSPDGDRDPFAADSGCDRGSYLPFRGDLHNHTTDSDGKGSPESAFNAGAGLDFLAVTDHTHYLTEGEYSGCSKLADKATVPGRFVAICGLEIEVAGPNHSHANFLFEPPVIKKRAESVSDTYSRLKACKGCVGQFNHPASGRFPWRSFQRDTVADGKMELIELNGAPGWTEALDAYVRALDRGWRVAPSWNGDTHDGEWGAKPRRTVVFSDQLSFDGLRGAIRSKRTCAADDENATLVLKAGRWMDSCWMGSQLRGVSETQTLHVEATDHVGDNYSWIKLVGRDGEELGRVDCGGDKNICRGTLTVNLTLPTYVFAVAKQVDDDHVVSAPIWFLK